MNTLNSANNLPVNTNFKNSFYSAGSLLLIILLLSAISSQPLQIYTVIQLLSVVIAFQMAFIAVQSYPVTKNSFIALIGILYATKGLFDFIDIFSGNDLVHPLITTTSRKISLFAEISAYFSGFCFLTAALLLSKNTLKPKILITYLVSIAFILCGIIYKASIFHPLLVYTVFGSLLASFLIVIYYKRNIDSQSAVYLLAAIVFATISHLVSFQFIPTSDITQIASALLTLASVYCIYAIINHICRSVPYMLLCATLSNRSHENTLLQSQNEQLQKEIKAYQEEKRKITHINRLHNILRSSNQAIAAATDVNELYHAICRICVNEGLFKMVWIGTLDKDTAWVNPLVHHGPADDFSSIAAAHLNIKDTEGYVGHIINTEMPFVCNTLDSTNDNCLRNREAARRGYLSMAAIPLRTSGTVHGMIAFYAAEKDFFTDEIVTLLDSLSLDIVLAVESYERKQQSIAANEALAESEEKFRNAFENAAVGMAIISPDKQYTKVNQALCEILGYTYQELLQFTIDDLMHIEDKEIYGIQLNRLLKGEISSYQSEHRYIHKQASVIWVNSSISLVRDHQWKPTHIIMQIQDVTKRKSAQEALRESELRYRNLMELLPDAVVVHKKGRIVFANTSCASMMGLDSADELKNKKITEFFLKNELTYHANILPNSKRSKKVNGNFEFRLHRPDGKTVDVEALSTICVSNEEKVVLSVIRDISHRQEIIALNKKDEVNQKLIQDSKELEKLKNEFFANISHELRTPINVILSTLQLLELYSSKNLFSTGNLNTQKYFRVMKQNCFRLIKLVDNIVDLTKMDTGFIKLLPQNYDIVQTISNIIDSSVKYVKAKGLLLEFHTEMPEKIMAFDKDKVERIILNLLSNAIKFTRNGDTISVGILSKEDYVILSVKDTGIGIPQEKIDLIFDQFRQVDKSFTRHHEGSGIGLSITKALVEMHGGTIEIQSYYGRGTEFKIYLPCDRLPDEQLLDNVQMKMLNNSRQSIDEKINIEFSDIYN